MGTLENEEASPQISVPVDRSGGTRPCPVARLLRSVPAPRDMHLRPHASFFWHVRIAAGGLLLVLAVAGRAAQARTAAAWPPAPPDTTAPELGLGGFVLDETFSVVGGAFYSAFYNAWTEPDEAALYTVRVREEPTHQFGAHVRVDVDDTTIFQTFLRPNARRTAQAARQAARRTRFYVKEVYEPREVY